MSGTELKKRIEETNVELCTLLSTKHYNLLEKDIIKCSQKLDTLIVEYMQTLS
ncbi:aspartyl-phosphate phosphatase Spo0E family protein [Crassaminicella profunda]|uniref:aspartyl-phosphate phosphatase Spo0E family protein n=1 Tax=Crassaminicella profunda TaxID=1286698 RepID=UPI001CA6C05F|nr:aspartyl-phosphate phosphatase Spo0E family protein [Crassaminicella profunda]QZY54589.1 aspartyl-phosphate phosphatase Spo0E family protein [Crassaminicella profunda]